MYLSAQRLLQQHAQLCILPLEALGVPEELGPLRQHRAGGTTRVHSCSHFITSGHSQCFTIWPNVHPFIPTGGGVARAGRQPAGQEQSG